MPKNVLITPLDWGLGHATRCIPVIKAVQAMGHTVVIAGSGPSLALLRIEFPSLKFFEIESYNVSYSKSLILGLLYRTPALFSIIKKEHGQVAGIVQKENIDFIISDNRYGCYHKKIPSAVIIHQLSIRAGILSPIINFYNRKFISRFTECWVPDAPDHRLSGQLSINRKVTNKFIGPLSRITPHDSATPFAVLALVSGPEPHRTSFEALLARELPGSGLSFRLVRGLPHSNEGSPEHTFNHLPSSELSALIQSAGAIISRPGYSTIMDLAALKKKAIFVPTPGQTEQLYLAKELDRKKIAPMILQDKFSLIPALDRLKDYSGFTEEYFNNDLLKRTLSEFLD